MTPDPKVPDRSQLAKIAGNDPDVIRLFERLFEVAGLLTPAKVDTAQGTADGAQGTADGAVVNAATAQALAATAQALAATAQANALSALATIATYGTMSLQNAVAVAITGGTITANLSQSLPLLAKLVTAVPNGAGASLGTLGTAPVAGNPTKWMPVDDNGTTRYVPTW